MADEDLIPGAGPGRMSRLNDWRRDLSGQIAGLPQSIAELRTAIADLRRVVERLEVATEALEHANRIYESSGALEAARVVTDATVRINEGAMDLARNAPGADLVQASLNDLQSLMNRVLPKPTDDDEVERSDDTTGRAAKPKKRPKPAKAKKTGRGSEPDK